MMQITVNPDGLSQAQREAVAGFILAYPTRDAARNDVTLKVGIDTTEAVAGIKELAQLQHEHETTMPAAAFAPVPPIYEEFKTAQAADPRASIAFGSGPVPLPPGAIAPTSTPVTVAPPPPATTAPIVTTPGPVSSVEGAGQGGVDFSAALAADAQKLAALGQSGFAILPNGVELDIKGLPWDARIHAESKAKIADGSWRSKRNLDPAVKASVEAELRQVMGAPAAPLVVPTVTTQVPAPPVTVSSPTTTALPPAAPAADGRQVFVQLVGRCAAAIAAGKLTQQEVTDCCTARGVPMLPLLANRLDLVADVATAIDAIIATRG